MDSNPYDNVEFPIRRPPGTGTWPGPGHVIMSIKASPKASKTIQEPKLSPVLEGDGVELIDDASELVQVEDQSQQATVTTQSNGKKKETEVVLNKGVHVIDSNQIKSTVNVSKSSTMPNMTSYPTRDAKPFVVIEQPRPVTKDFCRMDLNPSSQRVLEDAYTKQNKFYKLNDKILSHGNKMKKEVWDIKGKPGESLTYEQMIQGMLEEGEMLLLGGSWLHFAHLDFLDMDGKEKVKPSLGKGRLCLTNQRLLILCAEVNMDANLTEFGHCATPNGGYKLEIGKYNSIYYQNIPLGCMLGVEMSTQVGQLQESRLKIAKPMCCGLCSCLGIRRCSTSWKASLPMPVSVNRRVLRMGVSLPPWHAQAMIIVHLSPEMPLTGARDFLAQIHHHAPLLH